MNKRLISLMVIFLCIFMTNPLWAQEGNRLKIGDECPGFFVKRIDGENFFLKEYVGENAPKKIKGLLFSFCSSTCEPCKKEIPELEKMQEKYKDKGLETILINVGENEDLARKLIKEVNTKLPVLLDRYMVVSKRLGVSAVPYTILLDGMGKVKYINTGFAEDKTEEFLKILEDKVSEILDI